MTFRCRAASRAVRFANVPPCVKNAPGFFSKTHELCDGLHHRFLHRTARGAHFIDRHAIIQQAPSLPEATPTQEAEQQLGDPHNVGRAGDSIVEALPPKSLPITTPHLPDPNLTLKS